MHGIIQCLVLENLAHPFNKPNIVDFKLGIKFWDENSSEAKRARMDIVTHETTSFATGMRVTAFQVNSK
jgi:1D-myo-inositol-tetrakisphosphate 5-kinase/inositol-polyphosphate multikinase